MHGMTGRLRPMSGRFVALIVFLALLSTAEPMLHAHPLAGAGSGAATPCAACACEARITPKPPVVVAPRAVAYAVAGITLVAVPTRPSLALPARAPPAA